MLRQTHIIHVGFLRFCVRKDHRVIPEAESLRGPAALRHSEKALAVHAFHTHHQTVFPVQLDRAAVERGIDAEALHHEGIAFRVCVIHPEGRDVLPCQNGVTVTVEDAVVKMFIHGVRTADNPFIGFHQGIKTAADHVHFLSCCSSGISEAR